MERMRLANEIEFRSPQESMLAVFALQEERKRLRKEARRQKEMRMQEEQRRETEAVIVAIRMSLQRTATNRSNKNILMQDMQLNF